MRCRSRRCKCRARVEGQTPAVQESDFCFLCAVSRVACGVECGGVRLLPCRCSLCRRSCTRYRVWLGTGAFSHPFSSPCPCACEAPRATILRPVNLSAYRFLVPAQPVPHACAHARIYCYPVGRSLAVSMRRGLNKRELNAAAFHTHTAAEQLHQVARQGRGRQPGLLWPCALVTVCRCLIAFSRSFVSVCGIALRLCGIAL